MPGQFVKFSSVAGELAPAYRNRTDLQKYDLALSRGDNWFIDYQGGLSTRPGTEFLDYIKDDDKNVKMVPFQYSFGIANTYVVLFGNNYIRFLQDGAYVLENQKAVASVSVHRITAPGHGFSNGDWVKAKKFNDAALDGHTFVVTAATTNEFNLLTVDGAAVLIPVWSTSARIARIYTLASPFGTVRIESLVTHQLYDTIRITSSEQIFSPYDLIRVKSDEWTLTKTDFTNSIPRPTGLTGSGDTSSGDSTVIFAVTAVSKEDEESLPSDRLFIPGLRDYTTTTGYARIQWTPQENVRYYNVYRSIVGRDGNMTLAQPLGFLGRAYGATFTDNNIVPDFTVTPPVGINPFADSGISFINVDSPGTGYDKLSTVTVTDATGSGFEGFPVVSKTGQLLAIVVVNSGQDYTAPVVTVSIGAGAVLSVELTEADGNKPAVGCVFQQRQVYASTFNRPLGIIGSRIGLYNNFDVSTLVLANDSYSFDIDSDIIERIKHLLPTRAGLLITTAAGLWQLSGTNDGPVTAIDAGADRQSYTGVADVPPLKLNEDIAIIDAENKSARLLAYSDYQKSYMSNDISILSNHFFDSNNPIISWDYFNGPHRLIKAVRADGSMIVGCVVKEHDIFGWTKWTTQGYFKQVMRLREEIEDRCYCIVERTLNGVVHKLIERFAPRNITDLEDYVGVDCSLTLPRLSYDVSVQPNQLIGRVRLTTTSATFDSSMIGWRWRGGGGRGEVIGFVSNKIIDVELDTPIRAKVPETEIPALLAPGEWSLDPPTTRIGGIEHLEGMSVSVLRDGDTYLAKSVVNGVVHFGTAEFTRAVAGLPFTCIGQALALSSPNKAVEYSRKRVVAIALWQNESRGLKVGARLAKLYSLNEKSDENYNQFTQLFSGISFSSVEGSWRPEDTFFFIQDEPLPASLLGAMIEADVGDDDD